MQPKLVCKSHNVYNSSWHLDSDSKRISGLACVEKKSVLSLFSYEISEFTFFKYSLFRNVKELFKCNQNWCASPTMYIIPHGI